MLLNNVEPSRKRSRRLIHDEFENRYGYMSPWGALYYAPEISTVTSYTDESIQDEKKPRFRMKPCISTRRTVRYKPFILGPNYADNVEGNTGICGGRKFWGVDMGGADLPLPLNPTEVVKRADVQQAISEVLNDYYRMLYSVNYADIPDMTVFLKELPEVVQFWHQIRRFSKVLSSLIVNLEKNRTKRYRKTVKDEIRQIPGEYLAWNFGPIPTISDVCKLLEAILSKWTSTSFSTTWHTPFYRVREWSSSNPGVVEMTPQWPYKGCAWEHVYRNSETWKVGVGVTSFFDTHITGSGVEKCLAAMLGLLGMLPNIETVWELTKLSWFFDHFVRVDKLFRASGLMSFSPKAAHIYQSCCSVRIERTWSQVDPACCRKTEITCEDMYYERAIGHEPLEFLLDWTRWPSLKQASLDIAYVLQRLV